MKNSGLKFLMLCEDLVWGNKHPEGMASVHYDKSPGVFYLSINKINSHNNKVRKNIIKHVFHHEFYHIIDTHLTNVIIDTKWTKLNINGYSMIPTQAKWEIDNSIKGFATKYSRNNEAEDKAEIFSLLISQHSKIKKILETDEILYKKAKLLISRMKKISNEIDNTFWNNLN